MKWLTVLCIIVSLCFSASSVYADGQKYAAKYGIILDNCYEFSTTDELLDECSGRMLAPCIDIEGSDGGGIVTRNCIGAETIVWDKYLNLEYGETITVLREFPGDFDHALREAQRAWITFRDAECQFGDPINHGGTAELLAIISCFHAMTVERTIELRELREHLRSFL
ncbi:MAG: lysozyme inhibitor LprI family protein [Aestuariivita sp.]|nr:lysozyme inhibitor LprI family protein [Aestuariivita sp.]MCY4202268.1 lysozyme inhibitor LprI family protein [Aestuariivita sp.]